MGKNIIIHDKIIKLKRDKNVNWINIRYTYSRQR